MASVVFKYFSGDVELISIHSIKNESFDALFPGVKGRRYDCMYKWAGRNPENNALMPVTRIIEYKKNPSLHKCDGRCMGARGGVCECSCGGKNHGISR